MRKQDLIKRIKQLNEQMLSNRFTASEKLAIADEIRLRETALHKEFNLSYEEIEEAMFS